jgi:hypothetical protein
MEDDAREKTKLSAYQIATMLCEQKARLLLYDDTLKADGTRIPGLSPRPVLRLVIVASGQEYGWEMQITEEDKCSMGGILDFVIKFVIKNLSPIITNQEKVEGGHDGEKETL